MMNFSEQSYPFFNSISAVSLSSLGYCSVHSEEKKISLRAADFTLLYLDGGSLKIEADEKTFSLSKGKAAFIPKGKDFSIESASRETKVLYCVFGAEEELTAIPVLSPLKISVFGKAALSRMVSATKYIFGEEYINFETDLSSLKETLTRHVKLSENSDPERGQIVKNCIELLVLDNIKPAYKSIKPEFGDDAYMFESEKLAEKLTSYISQDLGREMTLDELSEKFFFSKSYIKRVYKQQTGVGIMQARTEFKIKKAKKMLGSGEKIQAVAAKLGFSSVNHFSSVFKKKTGISPTEYKKSLHF